MVVTTGDEGTIVLRDALAAEVECQLDAGLAAGMQVVVATAAEVMVALCAGVSVPSGTAVTPGTRFPLYSASKPIVATALHRLVAQGNVSYDDRVADHVPEFAVRGKHDVRLRHVLTHRAGIPSVDLAGARTWDDAVAAVCQAPAEHAPGERVAYHPMSAWVVLAAIIERSRGRPFPRVCAEAVLQPLGITTISWDAPQEAHGTAVTGADADQQRQVDDLRRAMTTLAMPGGGAWGTARDLARFYQAWLPGPGGPPSPLPAHQAAEVTSLHAPFGQGRTIGFGLGFIVGTDPDMPTSRGAALSSRTFGHPGWCAALAVADPARGVVVAATANGAPSQAVSDRRFAALCDLVAAAVPPATTPSHASTATRCT